MTEQSCFSALKAYIARLPSRYSIRGSESECVLATPFYLPDNSQLEVHLIEREDGLLEITDCGETVDSLFLNGINLEHDDRRFAAVRERFGIAIEGGEIRSVTDTEHLDEAIDGVIHAMLDLSYLVYTRQIGAASSFIEEIDNWLALHHIDYERDVNVVGKTNTHTFDYLLPRQGRPLLLEAISARQSKYSSRPVLTRVGWLRGSHRERTSRGRPGS